MSILRPLLLASLILNCATPLRADPPSVAVVTGLRPLTQPLRLPLRPPPPIDEDYAGSVLRLDNDGGTITAYRCFLPETELVKREPQETGCVSLGQVRAYDLQVFAAGDRSCRDLGAGELRNLALLAFAATSLGAAFGIVIGGFTEQFWRWSLGLGAGAAVVAVIGGYYFGARWCERGLGLVIERLYDEVQRRVPVDHTRLLFVDDRTWRALYTVTNQ